MASRPNALIKTERWPVVPLSTMVDAMPEADNVAGANYALTIADESYDWYRLHAIRSRRSYRLSEILFLLFSTAIPVSAVLLPGTAIIPAILGAALVLLTGLRSLFHWHENYVRFSRAREAVNAERRMYLTKAEPYHDSLNRDQILVATITRIEQQEMGQWVRVVSQRPRVETRQ
jgi:hypothetical protein